MTPDQLRDAFAACVREVAPDVDLRAVGPADDLRRAADLDSMDFLNLVTRLEKKLGVQIPEADYPKLRSIASAVEWLAARRKAAGLD